MRPAIALVGTEIHAVLFLPEIVGRIHIAQQRQLVALLAAPCGNFGDFIEQQILMAHDHHRHIAAEQPADFLRPVTGGIDHIFAADLALRRRDHPFVAVAPGTCHRTETDDLCAHVACALGERLRQLGRIDIAIIGIVQRARQIMRRDEGIAAIDFIDAEHVDIHALVSAHAFDTLELAHALLAMGEPQRAGDMVVHGIIDFLRQPPVQLGGITLHVHHRPRGGEGRHITRRMPGGARCQLVLLQKHAIGPSRLGQMIQRRDADRPAADDDDPRRRWKFRHA